MSPELEKLFHELADQSPQQRRDYYRSRSIHQTLQHEVEKLLSFDTGDADDSLSHDTIRNVINRAIASPDVAAPPGTRFGPYQLVSLLGQGGMGSVYRAERVDGEVHQHVAIKTLRPGFGRPTSTTHFLRERQLLAQLNHPSIARMLDAGHTPEGAPFLVMEYVDGVPIDRFAAEKNLTEQVELMVDVCDAVVHAHRNLIIHRDLKPSNIFVEKSGNPKLLDFGIARLLDDLDGNDRTETVDRMLTPGYASPEQIRGERQTTSTDVYSLGAVLYKLITGQSPHESDTNRALAMEIATGVSEYIPLRRRKPEVPEDIDHIVSKALRREPAARYPSVESLAADLRRFLRHEPISARPESLSYRASRFVRRNRTAVALAAIATAASIAGVVSTIVQAHNARTQRDFAIRQLVRAEELSELNSFLLSDAAPLGKPFTVLDLLAAAEQITSQQTAADPVNRVGMLTSIGLQYISLENDKGAIRAHERAYELSRTLNDPSVRARAACGLADALPRSSGNHRAKALLEEGLRELPEESTYALDRAFCFQRAAAILRHDGDGQQAIAQMRNALQSLQHAPYHSKVTTLSVMLDLAESYRIAGQLREAITTSEEAAKLMTALGRDRTQRAGTLFNNWALALTLLGRPLEAEKLYRRAIAIGSTGDNEQNVSPMLLLNYGRVLNDLEKFQEAESYVLRAYDRARRDGPDVLLAQALIVKGSLYRGLKQVHKADQAIDELEPVSRRVFPPGHIVFASIASQRALNTQASSGPMAALKAADNAVAMTETCIRERQEGVDFLPLLLLRRSETNLLAGRPQAAISDARRALHIFQQQAQPGSYSSNLGTSYLLLGRALLQQANPQSLREARTVLQQAEEHLRHALGPDHPQTIQAARHAAP